MWACSAPLHVIVCGMASSSVLTDPADLSASQWGSKVAAYQRHGRGPDDPDVVAVRQALAFHRVHRAIDADAGQLSQPAAERLIDELRSAVAR